MLTRSTWDVVIIGAGPGGSLAALLLSRLGYSVLLVDRANLPRDKVCGCCLAETGAMTLNELGLGDVLAGAVHVDTCVLRIGRSSNPVRVRPYFAIDRATLDHRLTSAAAAAGARVLPGWHASVRPDDSIDLRPASMTGTAGSVVNVRPRAVLVADGLGGTSLDERPEFGWSIRSASRIGLGAKLQRSPVRLAPNELAMLIHPSGYLGLVHLHTGEIDLAAAIDPSRAREAGGPGPLCAEIIEASGGDPGACDGIRWRGTPLLTRARSCVESGRVMVLGDAAGYVEPITGEGMTWAIQSAVAAAGYIHARHLGQRPGGLWSALYNRAMRRHRRRCFVISRMLRHDAALRLAMSGVNVCPRALSFVVRLLVPGSDRFPRVMA
ncbi:MAG: FAD-dependent monooxygenase [Phycisphaerae bacterium]|nr:FAD-dependent monooxygenase [Phycisphaerae bacterium]